MGWDQVRGAMLFARPKAKKSPLFTYGTRAKPRSGARVWAGSRHGRCCGSERRSAGVGGGRRASWRAQPTWRGNSPPRRSTASGVDGPQRRLIAPPAKHLGSGRRPLEKQEGGGGWSQSASLHTQNRARSTQAETWLHVNYADHWTNKVTNSRDVLCNQCTWTFHSTFYGILDHIFWYEFNDSVVILKNNISFLTFPLVAAHCTDRINTYWAHSKGSVLS